MAWTAPRTWVAGEEVTAALLNTHVRDNLKAIGDPRTAYTPTITAISGTFTTVSGAMRYMVAGKLVVWSMTITITTVGTAATGIRFTLPVTAQASPISIGQGRSAGSGNMLVSYTASTTQGEIVTYNSGSPIGAGHVLYLSGAYEAA